MDKLPSKNVEKLLYRVRDAKGGKLDVSSLSGPDRDRLDILDKRGLLQWCDAYYPRNDPDSAVFFVGPRYKSVTLSTSGVDYLADLAEERKSRWLRFGRDLLMLVIGAAVTLIATFLFNQLTGSGQP